MNNIIAKELGEHLICYKHGDMGISTDCKGNTEIKACTMHFAPLFLRETNVRVYGPLAFIFRRPPLLNDASVV